MGRAAKGSVDFRGTPPRWFARVTLPLSKPIGKKKTKRVWVDLKRPDLKDTPADKATAQNLARATSKKVRKLALEKGCTLTGDSVADVVATSGAVLEDFADKWFAHIERDPDLKGATVARYRTAWAGAIDSQLGSMSVADLTPAILKSWIWARRETKAASTVRSDASALTRFFKDAIAEKWIPQITNPMRDTYVRDALPTTTTPAVEDITNFSRVQVEKLLASPLDDYDFGAYLFDTLTGTRDGEKLGAQFGDLRIDDDGTNYVHVLRQAILPATGEVVVLGPVKTKNSKRRIPLHPVLVTWLSWWKDEGWEYRVGRAPRPDDVLFPSPDGDAWRPRTADALRKHLEAADLPTTYRTSDGAEEPFVTHSFRHTFASLLGENGVMGEVIDRLLGHAPLSTRGKHYQAVKLGPLARAVETLALTLPERDGVKPSARIVLKSSQRPRSPEQNAGDQRMK